MNVEILLATRISLFSWIIIQVFLEFSHRIKLAKIRRKLKTVRAEIKKSQAEIEGLKRRCQVLEAAAGESPP